MMTQASTICSLTHQPMLQLGDRGDAVVALRTLLLNSTIANAGFAGISVGDRFTDTIKEIVQGFQTQVFLEPDGIVGPKTWKALCADNPVDMPVLSRGAEGEAVRRLQMRLGQHCRVDGDASDGIFGPETEADVKFFQEFSNLVVDGVVGLRTWSALSRLRSDECV